MNCEIEYDELSGLVGGELDAGRAVELRRHLGACEHCRERMAALNRSDRMLKAMQPLLPPAEAVLAARRALAPEVRLAPASEIMTLDEVAEFLRITPEQLGEVVEELPAFELAGQIRVRRQRLIEWVQQRERDYTRQAAESWAAKSTAIGLGRGVA